LISKANLTSMVGTSLSASTFSRVQNKYAATAEAAVAGSTFVWSGGTADSTYTYEYKNEDGTTTIIAAPLSTSGEICAIGNIFDSLEALIPSGSSDPDFTNMTKAQLSSLLKSLNASSVFHSALPSLLDYALSKATSASSMVDLTYINTEVWGGGNAIGDDDIDSLVYLYSEFTDTSSDSLITKLTSYSDDFSQVPSAEQDAFFTKLEDFLNALAGNSLMNTVKTGKNHSFLDEVLGSMLHKTTLDEMITDEPKASAEEALTNYLAGITDWIFITDDYTTYTDTEKTTIDYAATSTLRSSSAAQNASEVLRLVHVIRTIASTGISLDSLSDPSKLEASQLEAAFLAINNSEVLHPAVSSLFDKVYKAMNFKTEYNEDGTVKTHSIFYDSVSGLDYRVINTDINRTYSKAAVSFWENEIDYFSQLFTALKNAGSLSTGSMSTSSFKFYDLLKPIDNMYTLRNEKEYIVLHMLSLASQGSSTVDVTSYLRDLDASSSFTSNSKTAARISSLLFWPGHTDDDLKTQCAVLDSFIAKATNLVNVDFTKGDQVSGQVFDLFMSTFSFTLSGTSVSYVRGYLAQEILAGLLKDRFSVANGFASAIATQMASIFYAADSSDIDYQYLNIIETRGLEGVLSLSAITTADYNDPVFVAALEKAFTLMGRNSTTVCYPNTTVTDVKYEYLLDQTEAKAAVTYTGAYALSKYRKSGSTTEVLCNSRLAITLFETYIGQVNATIGSNTVSLKLICDKYNAFCEDTAKKTTVAGILTAGGNTAGAATIMGLGTKDEILPEINTMENNGVNIIAAMNYYALYGSYM
jgi:hypothetical protein